MTKNTSYDSEKIEIEIVRTLLYFDLFSYPLTAEEIHTFLQIHISSKHLVNLALDTLILKHKVFRHKHYYSLQKTIEPLCDNRISNSNRAKLFWQKTEVYGKIIASFPFVKAVFISGSLSKNQMPIHGDIDYFLICSPNRLWIARLLLMLFKKVFLKNQHTYFCINYLIDESLLEVHPKNIFTATELKTLVSIFGYHYYDKLMQNNTWSNALLPNYRTPNFNREVKPYSTFFKRFIEYFLSIFGNPLNQFIFKQWKRYNEKKYPGKEFHTTPNLASHHVVNRQDAIPTLLEQRINEFL